MYMYCKYYEISDIRSDSIANSGVALSLQNLQHLVFTLAIVAAAALRLDDLKGWFAWELPKFRLPKEHGFHPKLIDRE